MARAKYKPQVTRERITLERILALSRAVEDWLNPIPIEIRPELAYVLRLVHSDLMMSDPLKGAAAENWRAARIAYDLMRNYSVKQREAILASVDREYMDRTMGKAKADLRTAAITKCLQKLIRGVEGSAHKVRKWKLEPGLKVWAKYMLIFPRAERLQEKASNAARAKSENVRERRARAPIAPESIRRQTLAIVDRLGALASDAILSRIEGCCSRPHLRRELDAMVQAGTLVERQSSLGLEYLLPAG